MKKSKNKTVVPPVTPVPGVAVRVVDNKLESVPGPATVGHTYARRAPEYTSERTREVIAIIQAADKVNACGASTVQPLTASKGTHAGTQVHVCELARGHAGAYCACWCGHQWRKIG